MSKKTKRVAVAIASPLILGMLKLRTKITGQERARTIIVNEKNQVLLVHEIASNRWSLPGGGIEKDEMPIAAAAREIREEIGLAIEPSALKSLGVMQRPTTKIDYIAHIFTITISETDVAGCGLNKRELFDIAWFDLDNPPAKISGVTRAAFELLSKTRPI